MNKNICGEIGLIVIFLSDIFVTLEKQNRDLSLPKIYPFWLLESSVFTSDIFPSDQVLFLK